MEIRFDNQVVLVTGASTGIGAAVARAFGAAGARVVVHYNNSPNPAKAVLRDIEAAEGEGLLVQADVTQPAPLHAMVDKILDRFGSIDILINNAGGLVQRSPVEDMPDDVYQYIMDLNMTSIFQMCKLVVPVMKRQGHGNIVNVSSIAARMGGGGGSIVYAASKGAVSTFTHGLAKELVGHNIRVNAMSPGIILTPFHERWTSPETMETLVKTIPMGRAGTPEECVGTVLFLASDAMSGYLTGQIIEVNGGQIMG